MKKIIIILLTFVQFVNAQNSVTKTFNTSFYENDKFLFSLVDVWTIDDSSKSSVNFSIKGRETGFLTIERYAFGRETGFKHFATIKNDKLVFQNNANQDSWWNNFAINNLISVSVGLINYKEKNNLQSLVAIESNGKTWTVQIHSQNSISTTYCSSFMESCQKSLPSVVISKFDKSCILGKQNCEGWNGLVNIVNSSNLPKYLLQQFSYPAIADKLATGKYYVQNIDLANNSQSFEVY